MTAHRRTFLTLLGEILWLLPVLLTLLGVFGAIGLVHLDRSGVLPRGLMRANGSTTAAAPARAPCSARSPEGPAKPVVLAATDAVVLFTLIVQGSTVGWVASRTLAPKEGHRGL